MRFSAVGRWTSYVCVGCSALAMTGCVAHEQPSRTISAATPGEASGGAVPSVAVSAAGSRLIGRTRASHLPLKSSGQWVADEWVLDENGYVGAYMNVPKAGLVRLEVSAWGFSDQPEPVRMKITVADHVEAYAAEAALANYAYEQWLPEGTHFVRIELSNAGANVTRELHLADVVVEGATLIEGNSDTLALAAADTYIEHYRQGRARVPLDGARPGTQVTVRLQRHSFNWGTNIPYGENKLLPERVEPGSDAAAYQRFVLDNFNTIVLSNGGKWIFHAPDEDTLKTEYLDRFFEFARQHGLRTRMHTLLWSKQQPEWVVAPGGKPPGLLDEALRGDSEATARLTDAISQRIGYYVEERAKHYVELDVVNESVHEDAYLRAYGVDGLAKIYKDVKAAAVAGGSDTELCLNEYNVLQWSRDPESDAHDPYANWYRRHADALIAAGAPVDCIGVQYYVDGRQADEIGSREHSAARIAQVLHNLSITGASLTLSEFSILREAAPQRAAQILEETMRLSFGSAQVDSFLFWAIWAGAAVPVPVSVMYDEEGNITPVGERYRALQQRWRTEVLVPVAADGTIEFEGFYGDYSITGQGVKRMFSFEKVAQR